MRFTTTRRWSDNDRHFGPFTFSAGDYKRFGFVLDSGGGDENDGSHIRLYMPGLTIISELPPVIKPYRVKVQAAGWDAATVQRLGRDWYYDMSPREYGLFTSEGALHAYYGPQTHCSLTTKSKCWFLPWKQWRFIGQRWYGLSGELVASSYSRNYDINRAHEDATPKQAFHFLDYDGEEIAATTHIEECEWHFGEGWFKWLSLFRKPLTKRSLDISFSSEVGSRKGSWKGGTIGHSIEMETGELHEAAFRRYCDKHELTLL